MPLQVVEFVYNPGFLLEARLFPAGTETAVQVDVACTELTGDKRGYYQFSFTDTLAGFYDLTVKEQGADEEDVLISGEQVLLANVAGTYQVMSIITDFGQALRVLLAAYEIEP